MRIIIETYRGLVDKVYCDDKEAIAYVMDKEINSFEPLGTVDGGQDEIEEILFAEGIGLEEDK